MLRSETRTIIGKVVAGNLQTSNSMIDENTFINLKMYTMTLKQRLQAPTPEFFTNLSKWGLLIAAAGATLLASPVALPALLLKIAGYMTVVGAVTTAVSQATIQNEETTAQ